MSYSSFVFENYEFNPENKTLLLRYSFDSKEFFEENYVFNCALVDYSPEALDRAVQLLFIMAGVSYYKAFLPSKIVIRNAQIDQNLSGFFAKTYRKGLGEFFYENSLSPTTEIKFDVNFGELSPITMESRGAIVGVGGGKDSIVSVESLRNKIDVVTWSLGHKDQLEPLVNRLGTDHIWVDRTIDPKLFELNKSGAYNGHVPISAILACAGSVLCILSGKQDIVMSNEYSANEETMEYQGVKINHQYSKSSEFEQDFQGVLSHLFGNSIRYYSLLRPFSELQITEIFSGYFDKYKDVFSSCNRAFAQHRDAMYWCGECPKCVFTFLALSNYVEMDKVVGLFSGKNLLLDPSLIDSFQKLVDDDQQKHFECVGTVEESRFAMQKILNQFPEVKNNFKNLDNNYGHSKKNPHLIPDDVASVIDFL